MSELTPYQLRVLITHEIFNMNRDISTSSTLVESVAYISERAKEILEYCEKYFQQVKIHTEEGEG